MTGERQKPGLVRYSQLAARSIFRNRCPSPPKTGIIAPACRRPCLFLQRGRGWHNLPPQIDGDYLHWRRHGSAPLTCGSGFSAHAFDRFIGRQHCMREKLVVDDGRLIAVTPYRMPRPGGCVLDYCDLEALLDSSRRWDSTHMFANMPPRLILPIPRLRSCGTRSLVCGPNTLCGLTTIVFPSSI
jgi:hypothetical protein